MHRFFIVRDQITNNNIYIKDKDLLHIRNVLRLKAMDRIEVSCDGTNYLCEIVEITKEYVKANIVSIYIGISEPSINITLFQGLTKASKMDLVIQKCVEIGVKDIYIVETNRSIVKIKNQRKEDLKMDRWQAISEQAAKQSKRDYIPQIKGVIDFTEMIDLIKEDGNVLVPYENEEDLTIKDGLKNVEGNKINLIIGPEGGFEEYEINELVDIGASIVTLGHRILRTETAGLVASTIILYELGDLGVI